MASHFDAFSQTAKNILFAAQEEMERLGDNQVQTKHLILGMLRQDKSIGQMVLQHFGVVYSTFFQLVKEDSVKAVSLQDNVKKEAGEEILTERTQKAIEEGARKAVALGHSIIDSEHILYAMMQQPVSSGKDLLLKLQIRPDDVIDYLDNLFKKSGPVQHNGRVRGGASVMTPPMKNDQLQQLMSGLQGVLIGIFNGKVHPMNMTHSPVDDDGDDERNRGKNTQDADKAGVKRRETPALDYFCDDFSEKARKGDIDKIIGREDEIQRSIQILCRKTKNNPILLGDPGVGKTAIVEGLALRIAEAKVPTPLLDKRVLSLSMSDLVAGTKYRGEFEERIKSIIDEASIPENEVILFIDEIHTIIGAGSAEGTLDAANILKPALSRGVVQVIGATTSDEHQKYIEKDAALVRRFQPILVGEPNIAQAVEILRGVAESLAPFHNTNITNDAIEASVELSDRYISDRFLPDKAIDLLDEACAARSSANDKQAKNLRQIRKKITKLQQQKEEQVLKQNYDKAGEFHQKIHSLEDEILAYKKQKFDPSKAPKITAQDIAEVIHRMTGIPTNALNESDLGHLKFLEKNLATKIVGQDSAIKTIAKSIRKSRLGLQDPKRPLGCFLFLGPTGVGKTALVKQLAGEVFHDEKALIKLDMSEFASGHTASRLVGASAGYVGYESGGELTEQVRKKPYSIILFDEIEKAHKEVHNLLLQILDDGVLTDGKGRKINFKNSVIVLTSNVGAGRFQQEANRIGFTESTASLKAHEQDYEEVCEEVQKDLKKSFSPEFLNRLDATVIFRPLDRESIKKIVKLKISEVEDRLAARGISFKVSGSTINALTKVAYRPEMGAREVRRVLMERVEDPLVEVLLNMDLDEGDRLKVTHNAKLGVCEFEKILN